MIKEYLMLATGSIAAIFYVCNNEFDMAATYSAAVLVITALVDWNKE